MVLFVNTSTPRSGTGYFAKLMQNLGINCGHEKVYTNWGKDYSNKFNFRGNYQGESSYLLVPHLEQIKNQGIKIINQRREKKACIASMKRLGILKHFRVHGLHYFNYIKHHSPEMQPMTWDERLDYFYENWNKKAGKYADLVYYVEDMSIDLLGEILELIKVKKSISEINEALAKTPQNYNHNIKIQCQ